MTNGIIMSVYNGRQYILEQLDSLMLQSKMPDEIIIIDDGSDDGTPVIINDYIREHSNVNFRFLKNDINRGWKWNFYKGMQMSSADIMYPCDQDDIWHKDKIKNMSEIMEHNPQIMVLEGQPHKFFEDNEASHSSNLHVWLGNFLDKKNNKRSNCGNTKRIKKKSFSSNFMKRAPGCTLAVRKTFFDSVADEWFCDMPHDALVTYYANILDQYYIYDYEVIEWRQHVGSASRPKERNKTNRINDILLDKKMINAILDFSVNKNINSKYIAIMKEAKTWNEARINLVEKGKIINLFTILKYSKFYYQKRRILTDLKYGIQGNGNGKFEK